jgi:AraC-like DNA-binding protein
MSMLPASIREWREEYCRHVHNIDFEPLSELQFRASFLPIFAELRAVRSALSPGFTFLDEALVRDGDDDFGFGIPLSRNLEFHHLGRSLRLDRNDGVLMHMTGTGWVGSPQPFAYIALFVPQADLAARTAHPEHALMRRLPARTDALRLLRTYLRALEKGSSDNWQAGHETIRRHVVDLVALAITYSGDIGESCMSAVKAARLHSALHRIAQCFQDPQLSVATIAESQGISPRYLQRLMELSGISFTKHVNELRLQRAFMMLTETQNGKRYRISDIALEVGFSDISYFNRMFRSRFGETPSAVRMRSRAAPVE